MKTEITTPETEETENTLGTEGIEETLGAGETENSNNIVSFEYKELKWTDEEHTMLNFMLNHQEYGWIPYSTSAIDTGVGKQLWDIRDTLEIAEFERPIKSVEEVKSQKFHELNTKASQFEKTENKEMVVMSSLGFRINADPKAKRNIDTLIELEVPTFRDYDNEIHLDMTIDNLKTIKREISMNAVNLYNQKWVMEEEIKSLKTVEEVNNYLITFEMLDFNG